MRQLPVLYQKIMSLFFLHLYLGIFIILSTIVVAQAAQFVFSPHESVIVDQEKINLTPKHLYNSPKKQADYTVRHLSTDETYASYREKMLSDYRYFTPAHTQQAIKNMQESNGKKGLFFVHGVEFFEDWIGGFSDTSITKFIDGYPELLSKRFITTGSIIGFSGTPQTTLSETYASFGYIMSFQPESVALAHHMDMASPVAFIQRPNLLLEDRNSLIFNTLEDALEEIKKYSLPMSLSQVIHYPGVYTFKSALKSEEYVQTHRNTMNEVDLFTAIKTSSDEIVYPQIEGVFINPCRELNVGYDHQNVYQNTKQWIDLFSAWAKRHNLPIVLMNYTNVDTDYEVKNECKHFGNQRPPHVAVALGSALHYVGPCEVCHGPFIKNDSTPVSEDVLRSFGVDPSLE